MMIQLKGINKTYFNGALLHVLKGIDLDIEKGDGIYHGNFRFGNQPYNIYWYIGYLRYGFLC